MPVKVITTFTYPHSGVSSYVNRNENINQLVAKYRDANKIIDSGKTTSEDGLVETRFRVFADKKSYDEFISEAEPFQKGERRQWALENKVDFDVTVVEE